MIGTISVHSQKIRIKNCKTEIICIYIIHVNAVFNL